MLRAVLHELRDRSAIEDALRFGDALPPLARGIMLESWHPLDAEIAPSVVAGRAHRRPVLPGVDVQISAFP